MPERIAVETTDVRLCNLETRFPFEFGFATMTGLPHCFVSVEVGAGDTTPTGLAADHCPPKWPTKDPDRSIESAAEDMLAVVERACAHAEGREEPSVFDCWRDVYRAQREWAANTDHPPLLWAFGVTFVERAIIDAVCRSTDTTFAVAVREGAFGIDLGAIYPELEGVRLRDHLPESPNRSMRIRHTVGGQFGFRLYVTNASRYGADGIVGTIRRFVTWLYLPCIVVLLGGAVNAVLRETWLDLEWLSLSRAGVAISDTYYRLTDGPLPPTGSLRRFPVPARSVVFR